MGARMVARPRTRSCAETSTTAERSDDEGDEPSHHQRGSSTAIAERNHLQLKAQLLDFQVRSRQLCGRQRSQRRNLRLRRRWPDPRNAIPEWNRCQIRICARRTLRRSKPHRILQRLRRRRQRQRPVLPSRRRGRRRQRQRLGGRRGGLPFNEKGEYLTKIGAAGTGSGQFGRPTDIAITPTGNLWVTDAGNSRLEEFNEKGEFLKSVGSSGSGNLQFSEPEAVAVDAKGDVWVGDTYNHRVQELNEKGEFIRAFGSYGSGQGQIVESTGIAIGPGGNIWVADWGNNRVEEFSEAGEFIRQFGSEGTGNGQFKHPDVVEVDSRGDVWVGDQSNARFQEFNQKGEYLTQFGSAGSGAGQFSFGWPMGIATDNKGHLWVSDTGHNRVQKWTYATYEAPSSVEDLASMAIVDPATPEADPSLKINLSHTRVGSVEGKELSTVHYGYESANLTTGNDSEGETSYGYDASKRLNRIQLPNGTVATITYDSLSRATAITVDPAGPEPARTTNFEYVAEPRQTKVYGGGLPEVIYNIGEDGSIFKWAYAETAPNVQLTGSLYEHANSTTPIPNVSQLLEISATTPHQVEQIEVLINGEVIAAEKSCSDNPETEKLDCERVELNWVTNPGEFPAGQLNLEVIVTDFLHHSYASRFFVTVPQPPPPPDPEEMAPPTFAETKKFIEEYGLDKELWSNEKQFTEFIFNRLTAWENQNEPAAQESYERWGVPLTAADIQILVERESYIAQDVPAITAWANAHAASTYAGYYVDHRAGGIIHVGFTENQTGQLEALKAATSLASPGQVQTFPQAPTHALSSLQSTREAVSQAIAGSTQLQSIVGEVGVSEQTDTVVVGATNATTAHQLLTEIVGSNAPITVEQRAELGSFDSGPYQTSGRIKAGYEIQKAHINEEPGIRCTAGPGAFEEIGKKANGQPKLEEVLLTA